MNETFPLPSPESIEALELAVSRNNTAVAGGARVGEIQNQPIRFIVEQQLTDEQPVLFENLVKAGSAIDWEGIVAAERHARQELEAAAELLHEAKTSAQSQIASLEESVTLGIELVPGIEVKIRESASAQSEQIQRDLLLPAEELQAERTQLYAPIEQLYIRVGRAWSIPNLADIPPEIAPSRYPVEDPIQALDPYNSPSSALLTEAGLELSERDQRMLDVILSTVPQGGEFRHADVDTGLAGLGLFDRRSKQQNAFGRLTLKLIRAGILQPRGEKGGRSYILLKDVVPHPEEVIQDQEPTVLLQPTNPELEAEQPLKFLCLRSVGGSRKGYALAEGTFEELGKRIGGKDRQLAPYLEKWITCLFTDPRATSAMSLVSKWPAIRVTVDEKVQNARLYSFAPKDIEELEVGPYKKKRIILALLEGNKMAIQKVMDQHEMDSGRYASKRT